MYTKPSTSPARIAAPLSLLLTGVLLAAGPGPGVAQVTLHGKVVDTELGSALPGATVRIHGVASTFTTDAQGAFEAQGLKEGKTDITITLPGYNRGVFPLFIPASGDLGQTFGMDFTGYNLPEEVVMARVEQLIPRYKDFEARRQRGMGAFLRWDEIAKKGYPTVGDALRTVRGVRLQCDQRSFECYPVMARSLNCRPTWWIDGVEVRSFTESTPIRDVYGIEIYRGPGEIPAEYGGSTAACGVIVMWTKSRPFRVSP